MFIMGLDGRLPDIMRHSTSITATAMNRTP